MDILKKRLRALRESRGLNQIDVATAIHVKQSSYSGYERGTIPGVDTLMELAKFFDVSTDYLLGLSEYTTYHETSGKNPFASVHRIPQPTSEHPINTENLLALTNALAKYVAVGSPAGPAPISTVGNVLHAATGLLEAAAADSTADVIDAANALAAAGLQANDVVKEYFARSSKKVNGND